MEQLPGLMAQLPGLMAQLPGLMAQLPGLMEQLPGLMEQLPGHMEQLPGLMEQLLQLGILIITISDCQSAGSSWGKFVAVISGQLHRFIVVPHGHCRTGSRG